MLRSTLNITQTQQPVLAELTPTRHMAVMRRMYSITSTIWLNRPSKVVLRLLLEPRRPLRRHLLASQHRLRPLPRLLARTVL